MSEWEEEGERKRRARGAKEEDWVSEWEEEGERKRRAREAKGRRRAYIPFGKKVRPSRKNPDMAGMRR